MFETGMIKACMQEIVTTAVVQKSANVSTNTVAVAQMQNNVQQVQNTNNIKPEIKKGPTPQSSNATVSNGASLPYWSNVIDKIKLSGKMGIYVNLIGSTATEVNDMTIEVLLANKNAFARNILETHENKAAIEKIASMEAGKTMNVRFVNAEDKKKASLESNSSIENMITGLDIPINIIDE